MALAYWIIGLRWGARASTAGGSSSKVDAPDLVAARSSPSDPDAGYPEPGLGVDAEEPQQL